MEKLKLFATDMDGTFLRSDRTFDRARLAALLARFAAEGLVFAAASGRQLLALEALFADFENQVAFVGENGAIVKYKGDLIFEQALSHTQVADLVKLLQSNPAMSDDKILLSGKKGAYVLDTARASYFEKTQLYYVNVARVADFSQVTDTILKVTTNFPSERLTECENWLNTSIPYIHATTTGFGSGFGSIDIIPQGINKATGLAHLAQKLGLTESNIIAFGDQLNDLEMLSFAGTAVAVSNAVPEIKALADREIGSHDDDAVLAEMEDLTNEIYETRD